MAKGLLDDMLMQITIIYNEENSRKGEAKNLELTKSCMLTIQKIKQKHQAKGIEK